MDYRRIRGIVAVAAGLLALTMASTGIAGSPNPEFQQRRNGSQNRGGGGAPRQNAQQQVHARREVVRTPNFVPRPTRVPIQNRVTPSRPDPNFNRQNPGQNPRQNPEQNPGQNPGQVRRPRVPSGPAVQVQRRFTKTAQGRRYDNGLQLRKGIAVSEAWQRHYFPKGHFHYPRYHPTYVSGHCYISPFGFYFGVCVPFIDIDDCHVYPPTVNFIDEPLFDGPNCTGFYDPGTPNLLDDASLDQDQPGLANALDELTETFQSGNIDGIAALVDPNVSIAIYQRGQYKYSLSPDDYMDMTRDTIQSLQTVQFSLNELHQRAPSVFSASGSHTYRDQNGNEQTVWVSFVLQDISGQWTLTQVESAPAHFQNLVQ